MKGRSVGVNSLFKEIRVMFRAESLLDPRTTAVWGAKGGFLWLYSLHTFEPREHRYQDLVTVRLRYLSEGFPEGIQAQISDNSRDRIAMDIP
jgi:hypothetical protein